MRCPVPCEGCGDDVELSAVHFIDGERGYCDECWEELLERTSGDYETASPREGD
jgi:hypothetical protein